MEISVIFFDRQGRALYMNASALQLFHIQPDVTLIDTTYFQLFEQYDWKDEEGHILSLSQLPFQLLSQQADTQRSMSRLVTLSHASYKQTFQCSCSLIFDARQQTIGMLFTLETPPGRQQMDKMHQAITTLIRAALHMPQLFDIAFEKEMLQLPACMGPFGQYCVDLIRQVLDYDYVLLLSIGPTQRVYYIATSGLSAEQRERHMALSGSFSFTTFSDKEAIKRLLQNKECVVEYQQISSSLTHLYDFDPHIKVLSIPLFFDLRLVGILECVKSELSYNYSAEEILLARTVADLLALILRIIRPLSEAEKPQAKMLFTQEIDPLIESFLNSASHEFKTPLTAVTGNVQLALRRMQALRRTLSESPKKEETDQRIEKIQSSLEQADRGARTLNVLLDIIIDDVSIHKDLLTLTTSRFDLIALLREVEAMQQQQHPEVIIHHALIPPDATLFVLADRPHIERVITTYLINAIVYTLQGSSVVIAVEKTHEMGRVLVSDKGPTIACGPQENVWERFNPSRTTTPVHAFDWSLGLGLYLCREIIQRHHGQVGFESTPEHGTTFWFTLPIIKDASEHPRNETAIITRRKEPITPAQWDE